MSEANNVVMVVATGGPLGGKSTSMNMVESEYGGQVAVMPEVATGLLSSGYPKPGVDVKFSAEWMYQFQHAVFPTQKSMETMYIQKAVESDARMVLCDRGLLDGAAYYGKGLEAFLDMFGLTQAEVNNRYATVLHIQSVAVDYPELYEKLKHTNQARYESAAEAARLDAEIQKMWSGHPNQIIIPASLGKDGVTEEVMRQVGKYLNTEIELKYYLSVPTGEVLAMLGSGGTKVRQGYIPTVDGELRIRQMGNRYYITVKSDGDLERNECERSIDHIAFETLWKSTEGRRIVKTRYFIPHEGYTLELDVYHGALEGLITLECELKAIADVPHFNLPYWATASKALDVTSDKSFKNKNMAVHGLPAIAA